MNVLFVLGIENYINQYFSSEKNYEFLHVTPQHQILLFHNAHEHVFDIWWTVTKYNNVISSTFVECSFSFLCGEYTSTNIVFLIL